MFSWKVLTITLAESAAGTLVTPLKRASIPSALKGPAYGEVPVTVKV